MPTYSYKCSSCGSVEEKLLSLAHYSSIQHCSSCQKELDRVIVPVSIASDYEGYNCPRTNKWISGRREHNENLKKHNSRVLESGETREFKERRAKEEIEFDRKIDRTVESELSKMSSDKLEKLSKEISSGAEAKIIRK